MSWSALPGCVWVVLVSIMAPMPSPRHKPHAVAMLLLLPLLLAMIAIPYGLLWMSAFFLGAASIWRYPLMSSLRRLRARFGAQG